jgi:hypothetical protein
LQQGAVLVVTQTAKHLFWARAQIKHLAMLAQAFAVDGAQHRAATGGQHTLVVVAQIGKDFRFEVAKAVFPFALEKFADRTTQTVLNRVIRINKGEVKPPGELPPNGCFARTRQTHQNQQHMLS